MGAVLTLVSLSPVPLSQGTFSLIIQAWHAPANYLPEGDCGRSPPAGGALSTVDPLPPRPRPPLSPRRPSPQRAKGRPPAQLFMP